MSSTLTIQDSGFFVDSGLFEPVRVLEFVSGRTLPSPVYFYQSGRGVIISEDFAKDFELSHKEIIGPSVQVYTAYSLRLKQPFSVIRPNFLRGGVATYATLEDIECCISVQIDGGDGLLVNNGYPSTFLVLGKGGQDFFVQVSLLKWGKTGSCWHIGHKRASDDKEFAIGSRFILPRYVRTLTI